MSDPKAVTDGPQTPETDDIPITELRQTPPAAAGGVNHRRATRKGSKLTVGGVTYEVIKRYRDDLGQVWCLFEVDAFPDNRPGARKLPKGKKLLRRIADPAVAQPRHGSMARVTLALENS